MTRTLAGLEDAERAELISPKVALALRRGLSHRPTRSLLLAGLRLGSVPLALARGVKTREVDCDATTLSAALREQAVDVVDLVKIDVEGSELEVLEGVADPDWSRLRQCGDGGPRRRWPAGTDPNAPRGARLQRRRGAGGVGDAANARLTNVYAIRP